MSVKADCRAPQGLLKTVSANSGHARLRVAITFALSDNAGAPVFTDVAEDLGVSPPGLSRNTVDVTHMQ